MEGDLKTWKGKKKKTKCKTGENLMLTKITRPTTFFKMFTTVRKQGTTGGC